MRGFFKKAMGITLAAAMVVTGMPNRFKMQNNVYADSVYALGARAEGTDEMQYGTVKIKNTSSEGYGIVDYYYTDEWFDYEPELVNYQLALSSMELVGASANDTNGVNFLNDLGFKNTKAIGYNSSTHEKCAYTLGTKELKDGTQLVAVSIQSASYSTDEWVQNFTVNHQLFSEYHDAINDVVSNIIDEISEFLTV